MPPPPGWSPQPDSSGRGVAIGVGACLAAVIVMIVAFKGCSPPAGKPHFPPRGPVPSATARPAGRG